MPGKFEAAGGGGLDGAQCNSGYVISSGDPLEFSRHEAFIMGF